MGIFQGTADQIASKDFVKSEINGFKNGEAKELLKQRVPKLPTYMGPPYDNVVAVYESAKVDENGLPLDQYYKHIPIEDDSFGIQPNFIIKRGKKGTIRTEAPINDLDCANKKYVDDAVKNASGGGSADLSNYYTKAEIDAKIGDIETLLGGI